VGTAGRDSWDLAVPQQVGNYTVLGHLATGGMAEVYLARQQGIEGFEKTVVLKRIRPELTADRATVTSFLDEARLVATLAHPNIAQVHEVIVVDGTYFIIMEYVYGADLRQLISRSRKLGLELSLGNALYIAIDVCRALHYAHEKRGSQGAPLGIIHRDISPSNVLISHDGTVKVCDFGVAKATDRSAETGQGVIKGKINYMSPEQCRGLVLDRRSDVFAIGILLYEITTMKPLFRGPSDFDLMRAIIEDPIAPPSTIDPLYPSELERIVMRALQRSPGDRYATAQDVQVELEGFAREHKAVLSSVLLKKLMGDLFQIGERIRRSRDSIPPPFPVSGSVVPEEDRTDVDTRPLEPSWAADTELNPPPIPLEPTPIAPRPVATLLGTPGTPAPTRRPPLRKRAAPQVADVHRGRQRWLALSVCVFGVTVAVVATVARVPDADDDVSAIARRELAAGAAVIKSELDASASAARVRVGYIATSPRLRAAIETDAATVKDLVETEMVVAPTRGEVFEVFRHSDGNRVSLVRMPASASSIDPVDEGATRIERRGDDIAIVIEVAVTNTANQRSGSVAFTTTVPLANARSRIAAHVIKASLVGPGLDVTLAAGSASGSPIELPVVASPGRAALNVIAYPIASPPKTDWLSPVRYAGIGLAGLGAIAFVLGLFRARRA
jgi:serine/threonine protein kinase